MHTGHIARLPQFTDGSFDVALFLDSAYLMPMRIVFLALREAGRILAVGGILAVSSLIIGTEKTHLLTFEQWKRVSKDAGFDMGKEDMWVIGGDVLVIHLNNKQAFT